MTSTENEYFIDDCERCGAGVYSATEYVYDGTVFKCSQCGQSYYWSCDEYEGFLAMGYDL